MLHFVRPASSARVSPTRSRAARRRRPPSVLSSLLVVRDTGDLQLGEPPREAAGPSSNGVTLRGGGGKKKGRPSGPSQRTLATAQAARIAREHSQLPDSDLLPGLAPHLKTPDDPHEATKTIDRYLRAVGDRPQPRDDKGRRAAALAAQALGGRLVIVGDRDDVVLAELNESGWRNSPCSLDTARDVRAVVKMIEAQIAYVSLADAARYWPVGNAVLLLRAGRPGVVLAGPSSPADYCRLAGGRIAALRRRAAELDRCRVVAAWLAHPGGPTVREVNRRRAAWPEATDPCDRRHGLRVARPCWRVSDVEPLEDVRWLVADGTRHGRLLAPDERVLDAIDIVFGGEFLQAFAYRLNIHDEIKKVMSERPDGEVWGFKAGGNEDDTGGYLERPRVHLGHLARMLPKTSAPPTSPVVVDRCKCGLPMPCYACRPMATRTNVSLDSISGSPQRNDRGKMIEVRDHWWSVGRTADRALDNTKPFAYPDWEKLSARQNQAKAEGRFWERDEPADMRRSNGGPVKFSTRPRAGLRRQPWHPRKQRRGYAHMPRAGEPAVVDRATWPQAREEMLEQLRAALDANWPHSRANTVENLQQAA